MRWAVALLLTLIGWGVLADAPPSLPQQRATLPPTWTPTFTPTASHTPTPTLTPTITPTLTQAQACEAFAVLPLRGTERRYYPYTSTFSILFRTPLDGVTANFFAFHRLGDVGVGLEDITRVDTNVIDVPIAVLPRHGLYDWRLEIVDENDAMLCTERGVFVAGFPVTATPSPTPNPNVTVVTTTPIVVIVTATPAPTATATPE
jgi:hypothetical protein